MRPCDLCCMFVSCHICSCQFCQSIVIHLFIIILPLCFLSLQIFWPSITKIHYFGCSPLFGSSFYFLTVFLVSIFCVEFVINSPNVNEFFNFRVYLHFQSHRLWYPPLLFVLYASFAIEVSFDNFITMWITERSQNFPQTFRRHNIKFQVHWVYNYV